MACVADIPCVGRAVDRISDATVEAVYRGMRYMFCYKHLVDVLNSEIEKVNIEEEKISSKVVVARADGKIIYDWVLKWQTDLEEFRESAREFSEIYKTRSSWRCIKLLPISNPVTRFRLGREALKKTNRVIKLTASGLRHLADEIAYLPECENVPKPDTSFQDFQSRKGAYGRLWEALVTDGSSVVHGIYGMPGVGKTRMMEQLWEEAMKKKIFDKVTLADVGSDTLDVLKLQNQIAGYLNCHFESLDNVERRAYQLRNSLLNGGKILVILDDVWREIPLDTIGIPYGDSSNSKGCKILLTSREKDVCLRNNCQDPVNITTLTDGEALDLFRNIVGTNQIDSLQDDILVQEVCYKCAGLPLLIHAVGKALKFRSPRLWEDALYYLGKGNFGNIAGIDPQAYACVKLSIDRLPDDAKLCLFLCSLFPEYADIDIRTLITLATCSQLIPARESSIRAMVDILKSSSLLLEGTYDVDIKLHNIVRDVASSLAFSDPKYGFLRARCGSRLPDNVDFGNRKLLRLDVEGDDFQFHKDLACPDLHSLWLHCSNLQQFSGGFFSMFVNLKFLILQSVHSFPEQFSLQRLGKLRELFMIDCDIKEKDLRLLPKNLIGLCIRACDLPRSLDLPNLKNLRKLEIRGREDDKITKVVLVQNTIFNLRSLEELLIPNGYCYFGNASYRSTQVEICELTRLTTLDIHISDFEPCQGTTLFSKLLAYNICVSAPEYHDFRIGAKFVSTSRLIEVYGYHSKCLDSLMVRAEELSLCFSDVEVSSICNSNREAFADLRSLYIRECNTMEHLVRESQHNRQLLTSFSKLTILEIRNCSAIKYLSNSVAKCFLQLQVLSICSCPMMEVIIMNDGTIGGDIIHFSKLKSLTLLNMRLRSFYGKQDASSTSIADNSATPSVQYQPLFDGMVAFPSLEILKLKFLEDTHDIWGSQSDTVSSSFHKLKSLEVFACNKLETVISLSMLHRLVNLDKIVIRYCQSLRYLFVPSIARDLTRLKKMYVTGCSLMKEIIGVVEEEEITEGIMFPELTVLKLGYLPSLTSFLCCHGVKPNTYKVKIPSLLRFKLEECPEINLEAIELGRDDSPYQLMSLTISCYSLQLPHKWQLRLGSLEKLTLRHYLLWHELRFLCFKKLKVLKVREVRCSTLFRVSVFRSLQQLQKLEILDCDSLEEIVEDVSVASLEEIVEEIRGHAADSGVDNNAITLFQLKSINLTNLPNLKSFSSTGGYAFNMPRLKKFYMHRCPQLETFTSLKTSTGLLSVYTESHYGKEFPDLNNYIREHCKCGSAAESSYRGSRLCGRAGESSYSTQKLETEFERDEGIQPLEERVQEELVSGYTESHYVEEFLELNDYTSEFPEEGVQEEQPLKATLFSLPWSCPWAY